MSVNGEKQDNERRLQNWGGSGRPHPGIRRITGLDTRTDLEKTLDTEGCANWQELAAKRARANLPGAIPGYEGLTFEQRRAAQDKPRR